MAFPNGWSRRAPITIAATPEAMSNFPVHLDAACFPGEALDTASANKAQSTGADLRFSSDEAGTTELPFEVVRWVQDAVAGNRRANVHVKVPSTSTTASITIYVWYGNTSATMPAATDANGREAVWDAGFDLVAHCSSLVAIPNSSGGVMADATFEGSPATLVDGPTGPAIDFDGVDDAVHFGNRNTVDATFEVITKLDATTDQFILATTNYSPLNTAFALLNITSKPAGWFDTDGGSSYNNTFTDTVNGSTANWEYWAARNRASSGAAVTKALPGTEQSHQSGVTDGTYLYSVGGHAVGSLTGLTTHNRYDPATNTWTTRAALPVGRFGMAGVRVGTKCYYMGGTTDGTTVSSRNDIYDITGNTWSVGAALPSALTANATQGFSACTDGTYVYVTANSVFYRYDPGGDSWLALDAAYTQGTYKSLLCDGTYIYAVGGYSYGTAVHRYTIATDAWDATQYDTAPYSAWAHAVGEVGSGEWVIGFGRPGSTEQSRRAYRYAPGTKTWTRLPDYDIPTNAVASAVISGRWYVYGAWCIGKAETYTAGHHASMDLSTWTWETQPAVMEFVRDTVSVSGKIVGSPIYAGTGNLYAARQTNGTTMRSTAKISEIRRSNVTRSRGWLTATRATLLAPTSLATIGTAVDTGLGETLVELQAVGSAIAAGTAQPFVDATLAGAGGGVASGTATLASGSSFELQAVGVSVSTGTGALAVGVAASAVGVVVADGAAGLTATVTISAAGLAEAAGAAGLTVSSGGELLANGVAVASGSAALVVSINLQATGSAESGGSAALVGGAAEVTLTAAGYAQAMAAGALTVDVDMTAAGAVVAGGTALATVSGGSSSGGSAAIDFALDDDLFYSDFAVEVNYLPASGPAAVGLAILDQPGITVLGGDVMATDFALRFPRGRFGPVRRGDRFVVAGTVYSAREAARPVDVSGLDEFVPLARA